LQLESANNENDCEGLQLESANNENDREGLQLEVKADGEPAGVAGEEPVVAAEGEDDFDMRDDFDMTDGLGDDYENDTKITAKLLNDLFGKRGMAVVRHHKQKDIRVLYFSKCLLQELRKATNGGQSAGGFNAADQQMIKLLIEFFAAAEENGMGKGHNVTNAVLWQCSHCQKSGSSIWYPASGRHWGGSGRTYISPGTGRTYTTTRRHLVMCPHKPDEEVLEEVLVSESSCMLATIRQNGLSLQHLSKQQQNNIALVMLAVAQHPKALQYASQELQRHPAVVNLQELVHGVEVTNLDTEVVSIEVPEEPAAKRQKRIAATSMQAHSEANAALVSVKKEKFDQQEELGDVQDDFQTQINFTDRMQSKIAELAELALAHGASLSDVNRIKRIG